MQHLRGDDDALCGVNRSIEQQLTTVRSHIAECWWMLMKEIFYSMSEFDPIDMVLTEWKQNPPGHFPYPIRFRFAAMIVIVQTPWSTNAPRRMVITIYLMLQNMHLIITLRCFRDSPHSRHVCVFGRRSLFCAWAVLISSGKIAAHNRSVCWLLANNLDGPAVRLMV